MQPDRELNPDKLLKPEQEGSVSAAAAPGGTGTAPGLAGGVDGTPWQPSSMGLPVTPHASNSLVNDFSHLLSGIDTLDLGLYVLWGSDWKRRLQTLDQKKQQARKTGGLLISLPSGRQCIFRPGGKGENYRFHLQFEAYNLFIGKAGAPGNSPNVYLSISAKTLWLDGIATALEWITEDLKTIGNGTIQRVQVSRVDLCADLHLPGGLSPEFLNAHKVTHNEKEKLYLGKSELQTYYAGDAKSAIQLRLYSKGLEVQQAGTKLWFLDLWQRQTTDDIWRIEYQLRRPALKEFGLDSLDDLHEKKAGLWLHLTSKWFSLRLPDNDKAERRSVHPFWSAVQDSFTEDAPVKPIKREQRTTATASPEWHLSHIDGCLSSFAAHLGLTSREDALHELQNRLTKRNNAPEFATACRKKAIQRGTVAEGGC